MAKLIKPVATFVQKPTLLKTGNYEVAFLKARNVDYEDVEKPEDNKDQILWSFRIDKSDDKALIGSKWIFRTGQVYGGKNKSLMMLMNGFYGTNTIDDDMFFNFDWEDHVNKKFRVYLGTDSMKGHDFNIVTEFSQIGVDVTA